MNCTTETCEWRGPLTPQRRYDDEDGGARCGLCKQPASETVVRRDVDIVDQPGEVARADREFTNDHGVFDRDAYEEEHGDG